MARKPKLVTVKVYRGPNAASDARQHLLHARKVLQPYLCKVETKVIRKGLGKTGVGAKVALRTERRCARAFKKGR